MAKMNICCLLQFTFIECFNSKLFLFPKNFLMPGYTVLYCIGLAPGKATQFFFNLVRDSLDMASWFLEFYNRMYLYRSYSWKDLLLLLSQSYFRRIEFEIDVKKLPNNSI